ncbi:hypothetical protein [Sphaerisporangium perillae]|uniref:hypothetical protein n=1 Tax=Sphaerisporangium perillae TaxID=2935860 RepID=UPI00200D18CF|nr:hypothetical protein [Sphaerisporangium perillae]
MQPPAETSGGEVGRRALLLSIGALALTLLVPVFGLALGVFSIVVSFRAWRVLSGRRRPVVLPILGLLLSVASICVAAGVLWVQMYFTGELSAYTECMKGAGTATSQQVCVSELERAVEHRLPFMPKGSVKIPFPP